MKILFISNYYFPHVGGVERHVSSINKILRLRGNTIKLITKGNIDLKTVENIDGVEVHRINYPTMKYLGLIYIWFWLLKNFRLILDAEVIHIHDVFIWYLPYKLLFFWKRVYITFHGYSKYPILKKELLYSKIANKLAKGTICVGDFISKWYEIKPNITIYGGVDLKIFHSEKYFNSKYKYDAIFSGRLDEQTCIITYLKALDILRKKGINLKLLVLGGGKYIDKVMKPSKVIGFVHDPSRYFKYAKFAFVNRYLAILEAFASKKLVFAIYDDPIKEDYLKMAPFSNSIIMCKNEKELVNKIKYYLNNSTEVRNCIESGNKWVQKNTWDSVVDSYIMLWNGK